MGPRIWINIIVLACAFKIALSLSRFARVFLTIFLGLSQPWTANMLLIWMSAFLTHPEKEHILIRSIRVLDVYIFLSDSNRHFPTLLLLFLLEYSRWVWSLPKTLVHSANRAGSTPVLFIRNELTIYPFTPLKLMWNLNIAGLGGCFSFSWNRRIFRFQPLVFWPRLLLHKWSLWEQLSSSLKSQSSWVFSCRHLHPSIVALPGLHPRKDTSKMEHMHFQ